MSEDTKRILALFPAEDLPEGEIRAETLPNGDVIAVYNVDGVYYVTDDTCTHGPGSLSEGDLSGHVIECEFHYGSFDIRTGEVVAPPCMVPLRTYKVINENDVIFIEV